MVKPLQNVLIHIPEELSNSYQKLARGEKAQKQLKRKVGPVGRSSLIRFTLEKYLPEIEKQFS